MKKIIFGLVLILMVGLEAMAQTTNVNIMQSGLPPINLTPYTAAWVKKSTADTLNNADTTFLFFRSYNTWDYQIALTNTKVSGYVRYNAVLQGIADTAGTAAGTASWNTITGETSQCSGCAGASYSVTNSSGAATWILPNNRMNYYRIRVINDTSATGKSTPTAKVYYRK